MRQAGAKRWQAGLPCLIFLIVPCITSGANLELELVWSARFTQDRVEVEQNRFSPASHSRIRGSMPLDLIPIHCWSFESRGPELPPRPAFARLFVQVNPDGSVNSAPVGPFGWNSVSPLPMANGRLSVVVGEAVGDSRVSSRIAALSLTAINLSVSGREKQPVVAGLAVPMKAVTPPRREEELVGTWEVSPRGDLGVMTTHDGTLLVNPMSGEVLATYALEGGVTKVAFADSTQNAALLLEVDTDLQQYVAVVLEYSERDLREVASLSTIEQGPARIVSFSPSGDDLFVQVEKGPLHRLSLRGGGQSDYVYRPGMICGVSKDRTRFLACGERISVMELVNNELRTVWSRELSVAAWQGLAISPDGEYVVQFLPDEHKLLLFDPTGQEVAVVTGADADVGGLGRNADVLLDSSGGTYVLVGSGWRTEQGGRLALFSVLEGEPR